MRYSSTARFDLGDSRESPASGDVVARFLAQTTAEEREAAIVLVGGTSPRDLMVREAQRALRYDRTPSDWSHAALVTRWPSGARPEDVLLLEVPLEGAGRGRQTPERNGVVVSPLAPYLDRAQFPNLALAVLRPAGGSVADANDAAKARQDIVAAAVAPNVDRVRFRLWEWLGPWLAYTHAGGTQPTPLVASVPLPCAAFLDYAYGAGRVDLTPGATDANTCPELIWQTLMHFYDRPREGRARLHTWARRDHERALVRQPLRGDLRSDAGLASPPPGRRPRGGGRRGSGG